MKTLYIYTQFLYPGDNSESVLFSDIVEFATKSFSGQIVVVSATGNDGREWLSAPNLKIIRQSTPRFEKDKKMQRIAAFVWIALRFWWHAIRNVRKGDVVFTVTLTPGVFMFLLYLLHLVRKFQYCLLVYDVFPDNLIPGGLGEGKLWFYLLKRIFTSVYRNIDRIVTLGCDMRERISWMTGRKENIEIIQNWADTEKIKPIDKKEIPLIKQFHLEENVVFAFIGNLSKARDIHVLLDIAEKIRNPKVKILFIGKGLSLPLIREYVQKNPDGKIIYGGSFPIREQHLFLNACDVSLVTLGKKMFGIGVPSKTYFNMACGKPLLVSAENGTEIAEMSRKYKLGEVVEPGNAPQMLKAIEKMASDPELTALGKHVYDTFLENYTKEKAFLKYDKFFKSL